MLYIGRAASLQGGKLDKSMKTVAMGSREQIQADKALQTLAALATPELNTLARDLGNASTGNLEKYQDVTSSFLASSEFTGLQLETSHFRIYTGIVKRLAGMSPASDQPGMIKVGILAGQNSNICDVIWGSTVGDVLETPEVSSRWNDLQYDVLGLVVWDTPDQYSKYSDTMLQLPPTAEATLLFLVFNGLPQPHSWHVEFTGLGSEREACFHPVSIDWRKCNRKKDDSFLVSEASRVGVSFVDQAWVAQSHIE